MPEMKDEGVTNVFQNPSCCSFVQALARANSSLCFGSAWQSSKCSGFPSIDRGTSQRNHVFYIYEPLTPFAYQPETKIDS